jgi:DNA repair protein RecO (recombination protein O)
MLWTDEGYLLSKSNFDENSIIIDAFTLKHGKYTGIVYGGSSRKQKRNFQLGNKILLNWKSKNENKSGYFSIELIKPVAPLFFDNKRKTACILSAVSILKILLPERQINQNVYYSFEKMLDSLNYSNWIKFYIYWEISLIKELGYETNFLTNLDKNDFININSKNIKVPNIFFKKEDKNYVNTEIKEALMFNKQLLLENFITPNNLRFPLFRNVLEKYYN